MVELVIWVLTITVVLVLFFFVGLAVVCWISLPPRPPWDDE